MALNLSGVHLLMDARASAYLNDREAIEDWVRQVVKEMGLTLLGFMSWQLPTRLDSGPGVSVLWEMVESHGSVETWPEHGVICADFYSCAPINPELVIESFGQYFGVTEWITTQIIPRFGVRVSEA
jgi:S-adenosylmethionine/arginine decarboxylase-like enzyme